MLRTFPSDNNTGITWYCCTNGYCPYQKRSVGIIADRWDLKKVNGISSICRQRIKRISSSVINDHINDKWGHFENWHPHKYRGLYQWTGYSQRNECSVFELCLKGLLCLYIASMVPVLSVSVQIFSWNCSLLGWVHTQKIFLNASEFFVNFSFLLFSRYNRFFYITRFVNVLLVKNCFCISIIVNVRKLCLYESICYVLWFSVNELAFIFY